VCFIFEYDIDKAKRIFPFDTGGFSTRYPDYIKMMELNKFDVSSVGQAPERLIGTFFSSCRDYYMMKPRSEQKFNDEFLVDLLDAEVKALHKLWSSVGNPADDRRCAIEVQFEEAVPLEKKTLLAVVLPDVYFEHPMVKKFLHKTSAKAYPYSVYSLNSSAFFFRFTTT
jgi:hypothetical protein